MLCTVSGILCAVCGICLIYAMISFLSVVVLSKVYIGIYEEKRHKAEHPEEDTETEGGSLENYY